MATHLHVVESSDARSERVDEMVSLLQVAMDRARRGELASILIFEDFVGDEFAIQRTKTDNYVELVGKLELAKHAIMSRKI